MRQLPPLVVKLSPALAGASALLNGYSQMLLQRQRLCGLLCLLAIAWDSSLALGGALLGGAASWLTAVLRHYAPGDRDAGLYGYNGALLGLLLGSQLAWSALLALLIVASAGLSSLLLHRWLHHHRQRLHLGLAPYSAPFVLLAWLLLALAALLQPPGPPPAPGAHGPEDLALAVLRGVSQIVLIDNPVSGLLILLGLGLASRAAALWALTGSALSLGLALALGHTAPALHGLIGCNGALVAVALGPHQRSVWPVLGAIALSAVLQPGLASLGIPSPLTAPFVLSCWLAHACQRLLERRRPAGRRSQAAPAPEAARQYPDQKVR